MSLLSDVIPGADSQPIKLDVHWPDTIEPKHLVLFCHGYKGFKDWGPWQALGDYIAAQGMAFIKFNFSHNGIGENSVEDFDRLDLFAENNYSKELLDLEKVLGYIAKQHHLRDLRIHLIGHSRGGGIVLLKAFQNKNIASVITLASVCDYGVRFPLGKALQEWKDRGVFYVTNGRTGQEMPHHIQFFENYCNNLEALDIRSKLKRYDKPLLVIHASDDPAVHISEAMKLKKWNPTADLVVLPEGGHTFGAKHPWNESQLPKPLLNAVQHALEFINSQA